MKRFMIKLLISGLTLNLTSCSTLDTVFNKGADANDELVDSSIKGLCYAYSVGSIKRKFRTQEELDAYNKLCSLSEPSSLGLGVASDVATGGDG